MLKLAIYLILGQVALILAMREFLLWYLKINRALEILRSIDSRLKYQTRLIAFLDRLGKIS